MLITQTQIATRYKRSLGNVRRHAMRESFPPPVKTGVGPTGRTNMYDAGTIKFYFDNLIDGRVTRWKRRRHK